MLNLLAHTDTPLAPHDLMGAWRLDPIVLVGAAVLVALHHRGRGPAPDRRRTIAFHVAVGTAVLALVSPLEAAAGALLSAHMVQHMLFVLVTAPLLVLARPGPRLLRGLSPAGRRAVGRTRRRLRLGHGHARALHHPVVGVAALVVSVWAWHAAALYEAALRTEVVHVAEHTVLLAGGWLFWAAVAAAGRAGRHATAVGMLFVAALQGVLLSVLLLFAGTPWYATQARAAMAFGVDPQTDQQLAGLVLWLPSTAVYVGTAMWHVARALRDDAAGAVST